MNININKTDGLSERIISSPNYKLSSNHKQTNEPELLKPADKEEIEIDVGNVITLGGIMYKLIEASGFDTVGAYKMDLWEKLLNIHVVGYCTQIPFSLHRGYATFQRIS